jgi:predicted nucleic acid-binding protein
MTGRVFVDTNILIYALDPADPSKRQVSADLLRQTITNRSLALSPQSLNEAYRVLTQRRRIMPAAAAREYLSTLAPWAIAPLDAKTTERAFAVEDETGYSWWDSLMLASALQADCRIFVTEDLQDGRTVTGTGTLGGAEPALPRKSAAAGLRIANPFAATFAKALPAK